MARPRTGGALHIRERDGAEWWYSQITTGPKGNTRRVLRAIGPVADMTEDVAAKRVKAMVTGIIKLDVKAAPKTCAEMSEWFDAWIAARRAKGYTSVREDESQWLHHIAPILGGTHIRDWTTAMLRALSHSLEAKVQEKKLARKSACNIYGKATAMLKDAMSSNDPSMRVFDDDAPDPTKHARAPEKGEDKQSEWLFPCEALTFLSCDDVPLPWRIASALALYTGLRLGELSVLRVADVVISGGYISVHKALDRRSRTGETKSPKGKRARRVPIEPALRPLLVALTEGRGAGELLHRMPAHGKMGGGLRRELRRAKLDREELFARDDDRRPIDWHDLRHTFATWLALRGEPELVIQNRLGHASADMTQHYICQAESVGNGDIGKPFPALPEALSQGGAMNGRVSQPSGSGGPIALKSLPKTTGRRGQDQSYLVDIIDDLGDSDRATSIDPSSTDPDPSNQSAADPTPVGCATEDPLERALALAAEAGQWTIVGQLAAQLDARRLASAGNVVAIDPKRRGRRG